MILWITLSAFLALLSGLAEGLQDIITNTVHYRMAARKWSFLRSGFWNRDLSWKRKYKDIFGKLKPHWWYFSLYTPERNERFPFSSTLLVFLTDGYHLVKFVQATCVLLMGILTWYSEFWLVPVIYHFCSMIYFHITYRKLLCR